MTTVLIIYIFLVFVSFYLFKDRPMRPRIFTALVWPLICLGIGLFALVFWLLTMPERLR